MKLIVHAVASSLCLHNAYVLIEFYIKMLIVVDSRYYSTPCKVKISNDFFEVHGCRLCPYLVALP